MGWKEQKTLVRPHLASTSWLLTNPRGLGFAQKWPQERFHQFTGWGDHSCPPSTFNWSREAKMLDRQWRRESGYCAGRGRSQMKTIEPWPHPSWLYADKAQPVAPPHEPRHAPLRRVPEWTQGAGQLNANHPWQPTPRGHCPPSPSASSLPTGFCRAEEGLGPPSSWLPATPQAPRRWEKGLSQVGT